MLSWRAMTNLLITPWNALAFMPEIGHRAFQRFLP